MASSHGGAQKSLKNFGCTSQPDLISTTATTIKTTLSDIAIFFSLHTPVSIHSDSLVLNGQRAAGPDHKIMLTFHRVWDEWEKWVYDTLNNEHRIMGYFWCLSSRHWQWNEHSHKQKCTYLISWQLNCEERCREFILWHCLSQCEPNPVPQYQMG